MLSRVAIAMTAPLRRTATTRQQTARRHAGSLVAMTSSQLESLNPTGFRAGAETPGTCATSAKLVSEANGVVSGIWKCTPGAFTFPNRPNTESVLILSGRVRLTDVTTGKVSELAAGDAAVLELGSSVRWEILETVTKYFVVSPPPRAAVPEVTAT